MLDLQGSDVSVAQRELIDGLVAGAGSAHGGVSLVTDDELKQMVALETQKQLVGCDEDHSSCFAEIAGALGARFVISGRVGRLGEVILVQLSRRRPLRGDRVGEHVSRRPALG